MSLPADLAKAIQNLGQRFDPEVAQVTRSLCSAQHDKAAHAELSVVRDVSYGPDPRHRLDIYGAGSVATLKPVVIFVHGGAFVAGDKSAADGAPFYENVGLWAAGLSVAGQGIAAIAMTYRLAPAHGYPAGSEDIGAALAWVHAEGAAYGLDPARIVLMGQSAGAVHVATYLAKPELHQVDGGGVAAAVLISGLYDMTEAADNPPKYAYFGKDAGLYSERSSLAGLVQHFHLPLLVAVTEYDPADFQNQALVLLTALFVRDKRLPQTLYLSGHNHLSAIYLLGSQSDTLGPKLSDFVTEVFDAPREEERQE